MGLGAPPPGVVSREVDLLDRSGMARWIGEISPTHVIHLAARAHVVGAALPFYETNVIGTETLLLALDDAKIVPDKLIAASSANVYGNAGAGAIAETAPLRPQNHYGISKAAMEMVVRRWFDRIPAIITRPFNYTGPGQDTSFLFAKLAAAFARRDLELNLGNLEVSRDLSHVRFVADCYARLLETPEKSLVVNICSGTTISIAESLASFTALTGHNLKINSETDLRRSDEIATLLGDPTQLRALTGDIDCPDPQNIFAEMLESG